MNLSKTTTKTTTQRGERGFTLRSIEHPDTRVSVLYEDEKLEVMAVEIEAGACVAELSLWGRSSWHLVVEGVAIFRQKGRRWELLSEESLYLKDAAPYTIVNPTSGRVKLLTLLFNQNGSDRRKGGERQ
ncbi:MAG: hypothetical protein HY731_00405 [Candidatus Tectomicrobia bacterium]|nr:hypothetical protein [Candidatus Tectomicrobia bacterium]